MRALYLSMLALLLGGPAYATDMLVRESGNVDPPIVEQLEVPLTNTTSLNIEYTQFDLDNSGARRAATLTTDSFLWHDPNQIETIKLGVSMKFGQ